MKFIRVFLPLVLVEGVRGVVMLVVMGLAMIEVIFVMVLLGRLFIQSGFLSVMLGEVVMLAEFCDGFVWFS